MYGGTLDARYRKFGQAVSPGDQDRRLECIMVVHRGVRYYKHEVSVLDREKYLLTPLVLTRL